MICPNCSNKLNYWHAKIKIETKDGFEKVNQCPQCNGYFKESFPTSLWITLLSQIPMIWIIFVPDKFEKLYYSLFAILIISVLILLLAHDRKKKRVIQKKGKWVVVNTINTTVN